MISMYSTVQFSSTDADNNANDNTELSRICTVQL